MIDPDSVPAMSLDRFGVLTATWNIQGLPGGIDNRLNDDVPPHYPEGSHVSSTNGLFQSGLGSAGYIRFGPPNGFIHAYDNPGPLLVAGQSLSSYFASHTFRDFSGTAEGGNVYIATPAVTTFTAFDVLNDEKTQQGLSDCLTEHDRDTCLSLEQGQISARFPLFINIGGEEFPMPLSHFARLISLDPTIHVALAWNKTKGGVDVTYSVTDGVPMTDLSISLYWASGSDIDSIIQPLTRSVAISVPPQPVLLSSTDLTGAPANTRFLLASIGGKTFALPLTVGVVPLAQIDYAGFLGDSKLTIADKGCLLVNLAMALSYSTDTTIDPVKLNKDLLSTTAFTGPDLNVPNAVKELPLAQFHKLKFHSRVFRPNDTQQLRDVFISSAAPVLIQVTNSKKWNGEPKIPRNCYALLSSDFIDLRHDGSSRGPEALPE